MPRTLSRAQQASLAKRLEEAQQPLFEGQGFESVKVMAHLINIGHVEDARQMCLVDWEKLADLPVVGRILADELVAAEIREFTRFRIKMEKE